MKIIISILLGVLAVAGFYWFSIRPANIRSMCEQEAEAIQSAPSSTIYDVNANYEMCVHGKGLAD